MEAGDTADKASRLILRWVRIAWAWNLKFVKIRFHKHRLCKAQSNLDQRMSRFGAEFYSLHRQGETEFLKSLVIRQQLKIVEEAESHALAALDRIGAIEKEYLSKKQAIAAESAKQV
ncbi:MAG: hypothetical protein ABSG91_04025 [Syntrophobacteraceae bacterium]|jgi:hypothetical protein